MSVAAGVSDSAIAERDKLRGKISQARVKRYWPRKAPDWAGQRDVDDHLDLAAAAFPRPGVSADSAAVRNDLRADYRHIRQAEVVSVAKVVEERLEAEVVPPADDEDDDEALEQRRRRIRERRLLRERGLEEEELLPQEAEEEETVAAEEESGYEADSEDEVTRIAVVKPVFVQKSQRCTIAEKERISEEKLRLEELFRKRMEEQKVETRRIVVEVIVKEEQIEKTQSEEAGIVDIVDTDDELNPEDEYEAWKNREVARIKKDREARLREKGEPVEMVRKMSTEQEREEWERMMHHHHAKPKHKRKFLQKYYHRGAFFQETPDDGRQTFGLDDVYMRDFSEATGEDKMNKSILPKVMQVKRFGRKGRPKWTHLANEDTTHSSSSCVF